LDDLGRALLKVIKRASSGRKDNLKPRRAKGVAKDDGSAGMADS
tara:strand:- start:556 stop:687 length:132 start_codon:yes stop_codon:yes gene_type:complete